MLFPHIYTSSNNAVTIIFGEEISEPVHSRVMAFYSHLLSAELSWVRDIIPTYTAVSIVYDIAALRQETLPPVYLYAQTKIQALLNSCKWHSAEKIRHLTVPVCYADEFGPDTERIAFTRGISREEVIRLHFSNTYRVYMLGFLPGFAYMGIVDAMIAMPRLDTPRLQVAAGSVGIAGNQTGIYPLDSPGGWNIIGRTPKRLFDKSNESPCYFQPGDIVQFTPITQDEFHQMQSL